MQLSKLTMTVLCALFFANSAITKAANPLKVAASLPGRHTEAYLKWLCGPFAKQVNVTDIKPETMAIPADTDVAVIARTFITPIVKMEGVKLSQSKFAAGDKFQVTYYWRLMSADPISKPVRCHVHFRRGNKIYINHDHRFKVPVKKWTPGKLYVDGPYTVKLPAKMPPIEIVVQTYLRNAVLLPNDGGEFTPPSTWSPSWLKTLKFKVDRTKSRNAGNELSSFKAAPAEMVKPYASLKEKLAMYMNNGGKVLFYSEPMAEFHDMMPAVLKPISRAVTPAKLAASAFLGSFKSPLPQPYIAAAPKADTDVLCTFSNDAPALIKGKFAKGNTYYWAGGLGRDYQMPPLAPYFDQFFVRFLYKSAGLNPDSVQEKYVAAHRQLIEKEDAVKDWVADRAALNFWSAKPEQVGFSEENFGRFGWSNSDGMLVGKLDEDGTYIHYSDRFQFHTGSTMEAQLNLAGNWELLLDPKEKYSITDLPATGWKPQVAPEPFEKTIGTYDGIAWYRKTVAIPESLRDKDLELNIGAIDDYDFAYFNGHFIGATNFQTINAYNAPRHYKIPKSIIKRDGENTITIQVIDKRGNGGIVKGPVNLVEYFENKHKPTLKTTNINWLSKTMSIKRGESEMTFINSLALPGLAVESAGNDLVVFGLVPTMLSWLKDDKPVIKESSVGKVVYNQKNDGNWEQNVLIGWNGNADNVSPFFLIFQHQPKAIEQKSDALKINFGDRTGRIVMLFPYGNKRFKPETVKAWQNALPKDLVAKAEQWSKRALSVPVDCKEAYTVKRDENMVDIIDRYTYSTIGDDWGTETEKWAPVPPLVGMEGLAGIIKWPLPGVEATGCQTSFGYLYVKDGCDQVAYSLQIPQRDHFGIVKQAKNKGLNKLAEEHFLLPNVWQWRYHKLVDGKWKTWGGLKRKSSFLPPQETEVVKMAWYRRGLRGAVASFVLGGEGRKLLDEFYDSYYTMCNFYQPTAIQDWRKEPYSGIEYPVNTIFAYGSKIYFDVNEFCTAQQYADYALTLYSGDWATLAANWSLARLNTRFPHVMHDWAYMASGCRESGLGAWIDMINAELAGSLAHAELADAIGDRKTADKMLYLAARQSVPTRQRLYFKEYAKSIGGITDNLPYDDQFVTGFKETGPAVSIISRKRHTPYLYDTAAYGIAPTLVLFHKKYMYPQSFEFEDAMDKHAPDWRKKPIISTPWSRLYARTILGYKNEDNRKELATADKACDQLWRNGRWGPCPEAIGMISAYEGNFFLISWSGFMMTDAVEEKDGLTLQLSRPATNDIVSNKTIQLFAKQQVGVVTLNGNPISSWQQKDGLVTVTLDELSPDKQYTVKLLTTGQPVNKHLYFNSPKELGMK